MQKRLNDSYALKDIRELIENMIRETKCVNAFQIDEMKPMLIALDSVKNRIEQYSKSFIINQNSIISRFQLVFPSAVIRFEGSFDDGTIFFIHIYGIKSTEKDKNKAYDIAEEIEKEYSHSSNGNLAENSSYSLIPSFTDLSTTKRYYPEIYKAIIEKRKKLTKS